jgi:excisionase family DNA binding protein
MFYQRLLATNYRSPGAPHTHHRHADMSDKSRFYQILRRVRQIRARLLKDVHGRFDREPVNGTERSPTPRALITLNAERSALADTPGRTGENAMNATKVKDVLTTGEVAKICNVAPRTVSKWFDSGALHGYRIPGSKDRRIPLNQLIRFMKQHGMPLNGLMTGQTRILIVDDEQDIVEVLEKILEDEAKYEVEVSKGGFEAGITAEKFRPHVILTDMHLATIDAKEVLKLVKNSADLQLTKVIAMSGKLSEEEAKGIINQGFDGFLKKPFHVRQVIEAIEDAMAVVY